MSEGLRARVVALLENGAAARVGDSVFLPVLTLESGKRYGVVVHQSGGSDRAVDGELRWVLADARAVIVFSREQARHFVEVLEHERRSFEEAIEQSARTLGLPPSELAWSFPALELCEAMFATGSPHFTRLALAWLLPSELRDMRAAIEAVSRDERLPLGVRSLAERLIVPAG